MSTFNKVSDGRNNRRITRRKLFIVKNPRETNLTAPAAAAAAAECSNFAFKDKKMISKYRNENKELYQDSVNSTVSLKFCAITLSVAKRTDNVNNEKTRHS